MGTNWAVSGAGATRTYSYTSGAGTPGAQTVTATNNVGLTSATGTWTTSADSTAPSGGAFTANSVAATGGGSSSYLNAGTTLLINSRTDFTDGGSGIASSTLTMATGHAVREQPAARYGAPATITGTTSQTVAGGHCYLLTLTGTDNVGNVTPTVSTTVKVDTTAPSAPTGFTFSGLSSSYYPGSGTIIYYEGRCGRRLHRHGKRLDRRGHRHPLLQLRRHRRHRLVERTRARTPSRPPRRPARASVTATNNASLTGSGTSFTAQSTRTLRPAARSPPTASRPPAAAAPAI